MTPAAYKSHRLQLDLSQAELAALLGVTRATVNAREAGRAPITQEAAMAIRAHSLARPNQILSRHGKSKKSH